MSNEQTQPSAAEIATTEAQGDIDDAIADTVAATVRRRVSLGSAAENRIRDDVYGEIDRDPELRAAFLNQKKNPEAWTAREAQFTAKYMIDKAAMRDVPQADPGHPAHRAIPADKLATMSDFDWREKMADEKYWSELNPKNRARVELEYASAAHGKK